MGATVPVFLKHTFLGKSTQAKPYTARAHSRYIQRQSETHRVFTYLMPESYQARQRWFYDHENRIRSNGRTIDKFTISIPHDIRQDDAMRVLEAFGKSLGGERAPFMFTLQGFESRNHHAHFIFIDRDYETGKRVFGTTERNSTRGIKLEWERTANAMFEELGYDVRVQVKDWSEELANDNAPLNPVKPVGPDEQVDTLSAPEAEDADDGDEDMEGNSAIGISPEGTIKFLHDRTTHLAYLQECKVKLNDARERAAYLREQHAQKSAEAGDYAQASLPTLMANHKAQERLAENQREDGSLKGRSIGLFGYTLFKSNARKEAEQSQIAAHNARIEANQVEYTRRSYEHQISQIDNERQRKEQEAYAREAELEKIYGTEEQMAEAEEMMEEDVRDAANAVTLAEASTAFAEGLITAEEYRTYLREAGHDAELSLFDHSFGQDEGGYSL